MKSHFRLRAAHPITAFLLFLDVCCPMPDPRVRELMLQHEILQQVGGTVSLSQAEQQLDAHLHQLKVKEMTRSPFPPASHFFRVRHLIQKSPIFKLLQKMPKGGALHVHSSALVSSDWLVLNATYRPHCFICFTWQGSVRFLFSSSLPFPRWGCSLWTRLDTLRATFSDVTAFDNSLIQNLTLFTDDPETSYPSQEAAWSRFEEIFLSLSGLVTFAPVFKDYIFQGLKELYEDNISYLEMRVGQSRAYELDGTIHDRSWSLEVYKNITKQFQASHSDFLGLRIILSVHRSLPVSRVKQAVQEAIKMQQRYPDLIAGFDLVGREDTGSSIWYFREALSIPLEKKTQLPFFFHAGETDLDGTDVDRNLLDALLFNTSRLGHGFALAHHPMAIEISRKRGVAVELCPISNQVLKLVTDMRNHPASVLMALGHPLVVSSDDPTLFGTSGLSYDFYQVFVGIGGLKANLGTLKEIAINSIRYSSMSPQQREKAMMGWQEKWKTFVSENSSS